MAVKREIYISVDIEASGPIPGDYSMLSIGACVVAHPRRHFYRELKPISARFVPDALKVSGLSMTGLAKSGKHPESVMRDLGAWVQASSAKARPVMVAFNAAFDWSFVNWYFLHFEVENPFGIGAVDIKSYYMGLSGASWAESRSSAIPDSFAGRERHSHNALDDAREQASMFARMLAAHRLKPGTVLPS
jgi:DNA polymerase III alpha subunit (gram-positive type)